MRHRKAGFKLGRTSTHRQAMLRNMAVSLFEHGQVVTTIPKAKALQPFVEKMVTTAKQGTIHARRQIASELGRDRRAFEWLHTPKGADDAEKEIVRKQADAAKDFFDIPAADTVERNRYGELRKSPRIVKHIVDNVAPRFADRNGGYTRIIKLGKRRKGDAAELCVIQFVGAEEGPEIGAAASSTRRKIADGRKAYFETLSAKWSKPAAASAKATSEDTTDTTEEKSGA
ncbi:MAG: 50S ribosomal protein L17 [Phycisphaerales bacterium]